MNPSLFRLKSWLRAGVSLACVAWVASSQFVTAAIPQPQCTGDLIIKWRDGTSGTRKTFLASKASNRLLSVAQAVGNTLQVKRTLGTNTQLMRAGLTDAAGTQATVNKIAKDARVAYVVLDRILRPNTVPSDPLFATQNNLAVPALVPGGINAAAAWSITQGSTGIVVAVADIGYTDRPDLPPKILPGYNFISDPARAGNSFSRGTDAHDLDGIVTSANVPKISSYMTNDINNPPVSSWHGAEVNGMLAAQTSNVLDIAGVGWNTLIVPVHVSGKCDVLLSGTVDGMLWAGGINVSGVPASANPARVVNVSLGGVGQCSAAERNAVNQLAARGTIVVAATGNEAVQTVDVPANCSGAIVVTAHIDSGKSVSYTNVGPQVAPSAPGGDCGNSKVVTTTNPATCTEPVFVVKADSNDGTQSVGNPTVKSVAGTSFSTPETAGTIALMLSVQPQLSNAQVLAGLKQTARPHPGGTFCAVNTDICGAGLLDTAGAVSYAQNTASAGADNGTTGSGGSTGGTNSGGGDVIPLAGASLLLAAGMADGRRCLKPH